MMSIKKLVLAFGLLLTINCSFAQRPKTCSLNQCRWFQTGFLYGYFLGHTVYIRALMKNGAYAKGVNSVFPSMTYPSHTTIVTVCATGKTWRVFQCHV